MTNDFQAQMVSTGTKVADAMAVAMRKGMSMRDAAFAVGETMVAAGMNPRGAAQMVVMVVESFVMAAEEMGGMTATNQKMEG